MSDTPETTSTALAAPAPTAVTPRMKSLLPGDTYLRQATAAHYCALGYPHRIIQALIRRQFHPDPDDNYEVETVARDRDQYYEARATQMASPETWIAMVRDSLDSTVYETHRYATAKTLDAHDKRAQLLQAHVAAVKMRAQAAGLLSPGGAHLPNRDDGQGFLERLCAIHSTSGNGRTSVTFQVDSIPQGLQVEAPDIVITDADVNPETDTPLAMLEVPPPPIPPSRASVPPPFAPAPYPLVRDLPREVITNDPYRDSEESAPASSGDLLHPSDPPEHAAAAPAAPPPPPLPTVRRISRVVEEALTPELARRRRMSRLNAAAKPMVSIAPGAEEVTRKTLHRRKKNTGSKKGRKSRKRPGSGTGTTKRVRSKVAAEGRASTPAASAVSPVPPAPAGPETP